MQSTMHCHHHCTPPPLHWSQHRLTRHPPTAAVLFLSASSSSPFLPPPPTIAGCCVLGRWGRISWALSLPLESSSSSLSSPYPPQQRSVGQRHAREEEGMVVIALASTQCHCCVVEGWAKQVRGYFYGHHC
jgi:hypothetical protein